MPQHILDFTDSVGFPFYAYATDQAVSIIRTWAEHPWPITLQEAYTLRDQCGWTGAPDDGRFFTTPVSNGRKTGSIRIDARKPNVISGINVQLTTRLPFELSPMAFASIRSVYSRYRDAVARIYAQPKEKTDESGPFSDWLLPNNTYLQLAATHTFIKIEIESPLGTQRTSLAAYYENKYGPTLP